jgi:glycosyltransferase involved in cell wall biosynthesis
LPAFQKVLAAQPHARLLLVGGVESLALPHEQATHYWNQLQALVDNLGLNAVVHMTGRLEADAVSHCLYGADIGVLPFNHGVTLKSGSLLAMMAHALPVLATCSDPADPDLDEQLVRSIAPRDANGLATELIELLSNPTLQHQLGSAGYQFSQQFSWTEITKAHLRVYQTALAHRSLAAQKANVNFSEATSSRASGDRPLRILAYTDSAGIGGAEISLGHLVGSASKDIEITVVGISEQVVNAIAERRSHINSQFCSQFSSFSHSQISRIMLPKRGIRSFIAHLQTFQRLHPDIVHLNLCTPWAGAIGLATALLLPHLRVVRVDQLPLRTTDALTLWRTRFLCLRVDAHVAVGEASARRMEDFYALGRNSVISIPNCVPDPGEPLPPPDRPPGQMTVGSIGRLDAMKAHDLLLQAIAQVEGVRLVILGEGDQRAALETLAIELGVRDRLSLVGWVDDPQSYLAEFDVVALPSRSEGFPLVMVEAMLAARPIVATRVGSIPEAVIDNKTGILIEKNDVAGLAIALRQLRDNPLQRIQLGKQAREMAVTHFTVGAMTANYERLWHKLRTVPRKPRLWIPRPQD